MTNVPKNLDVTCYLDESGTGGEDAVVVAGLVMNKNQRRVFDEYWADLLGRWEISSSIHMKEFGRGGKLQHAIRRSDRKRFVLELVDLIERGRLYTIAAVVSRSDYDRILNKEIREAMDIYGSAFILAAYLNHCQAQYQKCPEDISFVLDDGNPYRKHVEAAHASMLDWQQQGNFNMGSLTFYNDQTNYALQAADVIAWAVRRRAVGEFLGKQWQPLNDLLAEFHIQEPYTPKLLSILEDSITEELLEFGHS